MNERKKMTTKGRTHQRQSQPMVKTSTAVDILTFFFYFLLCPHLFYPPKLFPFVVFSSTYVAQLLSTFHPLPRSAAVVAADAVKSVNVSASTMADCHRFSLRRLYCMPRSPPPRNLLPSRQFRARQHPPPPEIPEPVICQCDLRRIRPTL